MKRTILYIIMLLSCIQIYGQRNCGSHLNLIELQQTDPAQFQRFMELESRIQKVLNKPVALRSLQQSETIFIPVVVHIVHTNPQIVTDAQVRSQIEVLNEDFNRENADKIDTPLWFASAAGNANIRFVLATRDPFGNPTNGITRTQTTRTQFIQNDDVKFTHSGGHDAWNPHRYLNIWVCNLGDLSQPNAILGYAQFPHELFESPHTDGIVVHYRAFGRDVGTLHYPFTGGRTATHEVGHWLSLRHIWGDNDGCYVTIYCVDDIPRQHRPTFGCPSFPQSDACSPSIMFMNFMDFTNDACMNMFTNRQVERMRIVLLEQRNEMLTSSQLHSSGNCNAFCPLCPPSSTPPGGGGSNRETCYDGIQNQNETGTDCGCVCPPCGIGGRLNDIVEINSDCIRHEHPGPDMIPIGRAPPLFSGRNILTTENVKLSHGIFSASYTWVESSSGAFRVSLNGGLFFEQEGFQFSPYRIYRITFNFYSRASHLRQVLHFAFANDLVNATNVIDVIGDPPSYIFRGSTNTIPEVNKFYIGSLTRLASDCRRSDEYRIVTITVRPDDFYKQLWVYTENGNITFNSLSIREACPPVNLTISGERTIDCEPATFSIDPAFAETHSIRWIIPPNMEIVSGQGEANIVVKGLRHSHSSRIMVEIGLGGCFHYAGKDVTVGIPQDFELSVERLWMENGWRRALIRAIPTPNLWYEDATHRWSISAGGFIRPTANNPLMVDISDMELERITDIITAVLYDGETNILRRENLDNSVLNRIELAANMSDFETRVVAVSESSSMPDSRSILLEVRSVETAENENTEIEYVLLIQDVNSVANLPPPFTIPPPFDPGPLDEFEEVWWIPTDDPRYAIATFPASRDMTITCIFGTPCSQKFIGTAFIPAITSPPNTFICSFNPSNRSIYVTRQGEGQSFNDNAPTYQIRLYNDFGLVKTKSFSSAQDTVVMSLAGLPSGIYYVNIVNEQGVVIESQVIPAH